MLESLLYAVVFPVLVSTVLLLIAGQPWRRSARDQIDPSPVQGDGRASADWASAVAFAAAYLICHFGIHGGFTGGQLEAWEWLLLLVPVAGLLGVVDSLVSLPSWLRLVAAVALAAATGWFLVPDFQDFPWAWRLSVGITVLALFCSQRYQSHHPVGTALPVTWILIGSSGLPVLIASANAKFGLLSTSVAAAAGAAFLIGLLQRNEAIVRGAIPVVSVLFSAIFFSGHFNDYGEVPFASFALLIAAPFGLWIGVLLSKWQLRPRTTLLVGILSVAVMCTASLYYAWPALTAEPAY